MKNVLRHSSIAIAIACAGLLASYPTMAAEVTLSGHNEVPPVDTKAKGSGTVTVNADHTVTAKIHVTGMEGTAAHIHMGAAGANGPVIVPFTKTGENEFSAPAGAKLTDDQYKAYEAGKTYVNVHSAAHKGGEVRVQLGN